MTLEQNLARAEGYLQQFKAQPILHRIGGKDVAASDGQTFESLSPVDLSVLATVAQGTAADIDAACLAAKGAFADWAATPGAERRAILHAIADGIVARKEEIAFLECLDTGQSLRFMSKAALRAADNFRFFAEGRDSPALCSTTSFPPAE